MPRTPLPFDRNVKRWIDYSESEKGRLRHDLTWHNLKGHIATKKGKLRILDAGCGLGEMAFFLLKRAKSLVLFDFSEKMLENAKQRLSERHPVLTRDRVTFIHGRAEEMHACLPQKFFDVILCHTLLEYVEKPRRIVTSLTGRLTPGGLLSVITVNSSSEAFKLAILKNDLIGARQALYKKDFQASLFDDVPKHTFSPENLEELITRSNLKVLNRYGIRIFADYLHEETDRDQKNYRVLLELEKEASRLLPYLHVGRYIHFVCQKEGN